MASTPSPQEVSPFRPDCLSGKVAIITGGGSGICYEVTRQLLRHGCSGIVICGRRESFLVKAAAHLQQNDTLPKTNSKVLYKALDVRNAESCIEAIQYVMSEFGRLDILVNGAAGNFLALASQLKPKGFKTVMEIDTQGTYNMSHAAHSPLSASSGGVIVNISATLHYGATHYQCHVSAAKAAVDSLTRSLALEWGPDGIRVVGIAPGPIQDTPGMTKLAPGIDAGDIAEMVGEGIPLGQMGNAFDIAMAAVFLCTDGGGSNITGDVLVVDGGQWLYKPPIVPRDMVEDLSRSVEAKSRAQVPSQMKSKL